MRVWDANSGASIHTLQGHKWDVIGVAFSPDGTRIVSGSWDKTVRVWDAQAGACLRTLEGHTGFVNSVCFSPDGRRIVSCSDDRTVRVWDAQTGVCLEVIQGDGDVAAIAAGPEAHLFRALVRDIKTVIEDAATGTPVAWFPAELKHITTHPTESVWAGSDDDYLCLIRLERGGREG